MWGKGPKFTRGQSEVLGIVLLFALVLTVSGAVVLVGGQALNDVKADTSSDSAARTMEELQSKAAQSSSDGSTQEISFAQSGGGSDEASGANVDAADGSARIDEGNSVSVDPTAGRVKITVTDSSAGASGTTSTVVDTDLGKVSYVENDRNLAYQGGGVFRKNADSDEAVMVSPPEFGYHRSSGTPTLSFGITTIGGSSDSVSGDSFEIEQTGSDRSFPASGLPAPPLGENDEITITVTSEYYRAWGALFEQRTGIEPTYPSGMDNTVRLTLTNPLRPLTAPGPFVSGGTGSLSISNNVMTDSYDSTLPGDYHSQSHGDADVYVRSDVTLKSSATLNGNLYTTGSATIKGTVTDKVYHDGSFSTQAGGSATDGGPVPASTMPTIQNYDGTISTEISDLSSTNDNSKSPSEIQRIENGNCGDSASDECVLTEGDYYIDNIDLDGRLVFEPNGGTIRVAIPNGIHTAPGSLIKVRGDGNVIIYSSGHINFRPRSTVTNDGHDAPQFQIWQHSSRDTDLGSQVVYVGLIHAGPDGDIKIRSNNDGHIYGALVGDFTDAAAGAGRPLHYDQALRHARPTGSTGRQPDEAGYLQIKTTEVTVSD